jgi:hypothetical protein
LITYRLALAKQDHRRVTLILSVLILFVGFTGVYSLNAFGSLIFDQVYDKQSCVNTERTLNLMSIFDPVS